MSSHQGSPPNYIRVGSGQAHSGAAASRAGENRTPERTRTTPETAEAFNPSAVAPNSASFRFVSNRGSHGKQAASTRAQPVASPEMWYVEQQEALRKEYERRAKEAKLMEVQANLAENEGWRSTPRKSQGREAPEKHRSAARHMEHHGARADRNSDNEETDIHISDHDSRSASSARTPPVKRDSRAAPRRANMPEARKNVASCVSQPQKLKTDLSKPYVQAAERDLTAPYRPQALLEKSKFTPEIAYAPFPAKTKMPNTVGKYDGTTDPEDHLQGFYTAGTVEGWTIPIWCHMFAQTLTGAARVWFDSLPAGKINSLEELVEKFSQHFSQQKRHTKKPGDILHVRRRDNESLDDYITRFNREALNIGQISDDLLQTAFESGVRCEEMVRTLTGKDGMP